MTLVANLVKNPFHSSIQCNREFKIGFWYFECRQQIYQTIKKTTTSDKALLKVWSCGCLIVLLFVSLSIQKLKIGRSLSNEAVWLPLLAFHLQEICTFPKRTSGDVAWLFCMLLNCDLVVYNKCALAAVFDKNVAEIKTGSREAWEWINGGRH